MVRPFIRSTLAGLLAGALSCAQPLPPAPRDAGLSIVDAGALVVDAGITHLDAGETDAGAVDAGANDAGPMDAGVTDAGLIDAGPVDAGTVDVGLWDGGMAPDVPITTSVPYWQLTFVDDFRGKTGAPTDDWCFDELPAQCSIWAGSGTNNCDLSDVMDPGMIPPIAANLAAALSEFDGSTDWSAASETDIRAAYAQLLATRLKDLNKCTWSMYEMINWMATDYNGNYSSRFDPSRVTVDTSGKGYLELSAALAPVQYNCIYGGNLGGPNCQVYSFAAGVLSTSVSYWADPDPAWPGVYYAPINGQCSAGGTFTGVNCQVIAFPPNFLYSDGPAYWVDPDPQWPGVFYANATYACQDNIYYTPTLGFLNLTCPILNGGMLSVPAPNRVTDEDGGTVARGFTQYEGRFEVKARIPKGLGAFPAAWLMPTSGGWPYDGDEIDILEARDAANQAFQTYHSGKCYDATSGQEIPATDPGNCTTLGGQSAELSLGYTANERDTGELYTRDHVYSTEWTDGQVSYFVNDVQMGQVVVGSTGTLSPTTAPGDLAGFEASNFPTQPFYWILNHSTYVAAADQASWPSQTFLIDYVKTYSRCTHNLEFCPCGGAFSEGTGCVLEPGEPLQCPADVAPPAVTAQVYASVCAPANEDCPNGGTAAGSRCLVQTVSLPAGYDYWVDANPAWPGVFYAPINGQCPAGGTFTGVNCQVLGFAGDLLEEGVDYVVDLTASPNGIYYTPDFRQ